jgi:hypothetical protein
MLRFIFITIPKLVLFDIPLLAINITLFIPRLTYKILIDHKAGLWISVGKKGANENFIQWLDLQINTGTTHISVPKAMLSGVSRDALREAERLCKLNKVKLHLD